MEKFEITLHAEEGLPEFTDKLGFVLMELGVKFKVKELHDDFMTFEFVAAEKLDDKRDGKTQN